MEIKTTSITDTKLKVLVYGASGSGKTTFGSTAPKPIFASAENGLLAIADKELPFVQIASKVDLLDLYKYLRDEKHDYETVVIDSITEINEVIKVDIEKKTGRAMQLKDWGELAKTIEKILRMFRDLPMNVVIIAQEDYVKDNDSIYKVVPAMNGKMATKMAYYMDIVAYMAVNKEGEHGVLTLSNSKYLTKDRSKCIGNGTDVDLTKWVEAIRKSKIVNESKKKK